MDSDLSESETLLAELQRLMPMHVDYSLTKLPSLVPFRITILKAATCHRIADLCGRVLPLFKSQQLIPAFLVVRALMETVALLYHLHKRIVFAIDQGKIAQLEKFLETAALGSRDDATPIKATNILTALDKLNSEYGGVRKMYDSLSEFCHPNFSGVLASYSRLSDDGQQLRFGVNEEPPMPIGSTPLVVAMKLAVHYCHSIDQNYGSILRITKCA